MVLMKGFIKAGCFIKKIKSVYILPGEDSIKVYSAKRLLNATADTNVSVKIAFPANEKPDRWIAQRERIHRLQALQRAIL